MLSEACKVYEKFNATVESDSGDFMDGQTLHEFKFVLDAETPAANSFLDKLESKCAALATENAQMLRLLTEISENHDEYVNQDEYLYAGVPMDYVSEINAYVSRDVEAENPFKETDAFMAEVRASGVEQLASLAGNECQRYKSVNDRAGARKWKGIVILCTDFAAQLRQGGAA